MIKKYQVLIAIFLLISIFSCKKDADNGSVSKETISAKWIVSGSNTGYESFEFNESGNYIAVKNSITKSTAAQTILFGTYQITDNTTIELSDFGIIKITSIDKDKFSFSLTLQGDTKNQIAIIATKAAEIGSSSRTDLFCRTWKMISIDGRNVEGTEDGGTVLFSKAGTYLVTWYDGESGLAQWKWKDSGETKLCYSWDGEPVCDGENEVQIVELTKTSLKIIEEYDGESEIYVLVPTSETKSAKLKSTSLGTEKLIRKGLFKK